MSSPGAASPRFATALSTCKSSPRFSFRGRPGDASKTNTPGPGAYSHASPVSDRFSTQPRHGFGTAQRDRATDKGVPGPGQYKPHETRKGTVAAGFGKSPRQSVQPGRSTAIGPGHYHSDVEKTMGTSGPRYTAAPRPAERRAHETPGPGAYQCESDQVVASSQQGRPRSPKWGFGTSPRDHPSRAVSPGPGTYNSENDLAGPKFTMRPKWDRKRASSSDTPGPGAYDSNLTCFGD